jgi:sRNA-binding regulator protein Hfq
MNINALDSALEGFMQGGQEISITLRDSTTVSGKVKSFDAYVILLAGEPGNMVYRHSILKLTEKLAEIPIERPKPEHRPRPEEKPLRPVRPSPPPRKRPARVSAEPAQQKEPASERSLGTLGEAMQKWLKSQQGK